MVHVVTVLPGGWRLPVRDGESIERALARCGFVHRHRGCRRGGCGLCVADRIEGDTYHERPVPATALGADEVAGGAILMCRAVPTTDVVIDVRDDVWRLASPLQLALAERELGNQTTTP